MKMICSHNYLHSHISSHLWIGHLFVEHLHLGIDVVSLLVLIQRAIVPHEKVKGWVKLPNIVRPTDPGLIRTVGGKAVATIGVTCSHNKHIVWDGLEEEKELVNLKYSTCT